MPWYSKRWFSFDPFDRKTAEADHDAKVNAELLRYAKTQLEELSSDKDSVAFVHSALV